MSQDSESAADMAEALLREYIEPSALDPAIDFRSSPQIKERYRYRMRAYRLALVLMTVASREQGDARFASVAEALESLTFPESQAAQVTFVTALKADMNNIRELIHPEKKGREMSWAMKWFQDIGIDETNPATLMLFSMHWMNSFVAVADMVDQLKGV